jgi:hypothetical protein
VLREERSKIFRYRQDGVSQTNYGLEETGMAQMDDSIGALLKHLDDIGEADNTIVTGRSRI